MNQKFTSFHVKNPKTKINSDNFRNHTAVLGGAIKGQKRTNQNAKVTVTVTVWFYVTFGTYNSKEPMVYLKNNPYYCEITFTRFSTTYQKKNIYLSVY